MRIALLGDASGVHAVRWANALARHGLETHLLSCQEFTQALSAQVYAHRLPFKRPHGYFLNVYALRKRLRDIRPELLHAHYASGYGTLARLCGFRPQVLSVWGADVYDFIGRSKTNQRLVVANLRHADFVCSTSRVMAAHTQKLCPAIRNLSVTPFGIDTETFRPRRDERDRRVITIGTVKRLQPKYGIDTLIQGFALCHDWCRRHHARLADRLRLRIVGDGWQRRELEQLARRSGVAGVTTFVGRVPHEDVPGQLNKLDIYVAVSRYESESFGVAVLEACACEIPVVVSRVGGLPEVVLDGTTGLVVPKEDPRRVAQALRRLIAEPEFGQRLGKAGREHVMNEYMWDENVLRMIEVYQRLLAAKRAAA